MLFIESYANFDYTKIQVPIILNEAPSDSENSKYFIDISCDSYLQKGCYIGEQFVEEIRFDRISKRNDKDSMSPQNWEVTMIVTPGKNEDEVIEIIDLLCEYLSFRCAQEYRLFQNSGFTGFSFHPMDIKRRYAIKNHNFGDIVFNRIAGRMEMESMATLPRKVFEMPRTKYILSTYTQKLRNAYLTAMRSRDVISRYILLYYLFEIFYQTEEYQILKKQNERMSNTEKRKPCQNEKRGEILFQYLREKFGVLEYKSFGKQIVLTTQVLNDIIITRNDLTHRADSSNVIKITYHHLIPILQQILTRLE